MQTDGGWFVVRENGLMPVARTATQAEADALIEATDGYVIHTPEDLSKLGTGSLRAIFENLSEKPLARRFDEQEEAVVRTWNALERAKLPDLMGLSVESKKNQIAMYNAPKSLIEEDPTLIKTPYEGQEEKEMKTATKTKKEPKGKATTGSTKRAASASRKPPVRKPGSGALIRDLIMDGKDTEAILKAVKKAFPDSSAGPSDVSWNRSKLRKDGKKVPEIKK